MKKLLRLVINIVLVALAISIFIGFVNRNNVSIDIDVDSNYKVYEPIKIEVKTIKGLSLIDSKKMKVSIFNKYNKNESIDATVDSYQKGKYYIYVTPEYAGEYVINLSTTVDGVSYLKSETFLIK